MPLSQSLESGTAAGSPARPAHFGTSYTHFLIPHITVLSGMFHPLGACALELSHSSPRETLHQVASMSSWIPNLSATTTFEVATSMAVEASMGLHVHYGAM